ncbi:SMC-Scp complex subunit ScpB [Clostridium sp. D2Q-11]|uniref:Segregation and condensation protein B n=1 Tax=Anaeromonas frigoriresistens TaxID=2683708 RepID=A0A942Z7W4_9FIRM|nr:SMC-Scp complex subunit ScpB [Anaeromonas frigoriresistens]MBS4539961.1 SMC-Scp complex subunit ScpB [Anaeromonas frigoriresistens]
MDTRELKSIIEGVLYIWGEPLSIGSLSEVLEIDKDTIIEIMEEMINEFNYNRRGLQIIQIKDSYQLCTRSEHYEYIKKLVVQKNSKGLSNAALETLSIISYKQPITRVEIESIRGVKCDKSINTLIEKGLVEEKGRLDRTGKPIIYGTTDNFLKHFGLKDISELPKLKELKDIDLDENNTD